MKWDLQNFNSIPLTFDKLKMALEIFEQNVTSDKEWLEHLKKMFSAYYMNRNKYETI